MDKAIDGGERHSLVWEDLAPFAEWLIGRDHHGPPVVTRGDQLEQDARLGLILGEIGDRTSRAIRSRPERARALPTDGSCPRPAIQRHNAGCPAFEVLILYPFHPRAGQMVQVEHRKRFAGEDHLVVVQPDGTLALIPAWMSEDIARSATLTTSPRLAIGRLVELRARIDA
jgi:hypothetical protein